MFYLAQAFDSFLQRPASSLISSILIWFIVLTQIITYI